MQPQVLQSDAGVEMKMNDWNEQKIMDYLNGINQYTSGFGVDRARKLLEGLGHPEKNLKVIHVAGTNGKGSACAYLSSVLTCAGYRVGLFTSPHLVDVRERIQIGETLVGIDDFLSAFTRVYEVEKQIQREDPQFELAYFDYFLGIAFLVFQEKQVDFVVMETGLGGRLDATNAVQCPILSVITTISLEHTAILGDTITKIAGEKAGIIKPDIPVVYCADNPESTEVIENHAKCCKSRAVAVREKDYEIMKNTGKDIAFSVHNEYYKNDCFSIATAAPYQVMNAVIALTAVAVIEKVCGQAFSFQNISDGLRQMRWPGRMEEIMPGVYVDGAHNPQGIAAFVQAVNEICTQKREQEAILLFSAVSDKDFKHMIQMIEGCRCFSTVLITQTGGSRQLSKEEIAEQFHTGQNIFLKVFDSPAEAFAYGRTHQRGLMFCAGSLYLAGDIKSYLREQE